MSQNIQSSNEQNENSVKYTLSKDRPTNESQGELKRNLHESQGGLPVLSSIRSDGS
jgi:hypothetical protein